MTDASCAADQLEGRRRLDEAHRDRKVVGGGAIPLAPTSPITRCEQAEDDLRLLTRRVAALLDGELARR